MTRDRLSTLSTECLELILQQLADDDDAITLGALVRVSRTVCSATLPFLYSDPFNPRLHKPRHYPTASEDCFPVHKPPSSVHTSWPFDTQLERRSLLKLTRLLLSCIPASECSGLLRAAYMSNTDKRAKQHYSRSNQPSTFINYTLFLTNLKLDHLDSVPYNLFINSTVNPECNKQLKAYMEQYGLCSRYMQEKMWWPGRDIPENSLYMKGLRGQLCRDLTWALCSIDGVAEKIQGLTIPLTDIQQYRHSIHRFKSLSDLTFKIEQPLKEDDPVDVFQVAPERSDFSGLVLTKKTVPLLEDMLEFTKHHSQVFKGILQYVSCSGNELVVANIQQTNLQDVRTILWGDTVDTSNPMLWQVGKLEADGPFLQRCRSLEILHMTSLGEDMFRWAFHEKKQHETYYAHDRNPVGDNHLNRFKYATATVVTSSSAAPRPLVPLKKARLWLGGSRVSQDINDVVFGYCLTLESLIVQVRTNRNNSSRRLCVGEDWPSCARLRRLSIYSLCFKLDFHTAALSHGDFTALETLTLHDHHIHYDPREINYFLPAHLPKLKTLDLQGTCAFAFNPETLGTTTNLEHMSLGAHFANGWTYVPPMSLLEEAAAQAPFRPLWSWDWNLSRLIELRLASTFAFEFQFQMLEKTPELRTLVLDISTKDPDVKCHLDKTTLRVKGADIDRIINCEDVETSDPESFLRLSKLRGLRLIGEWHLPPRFWQVLCRLVTRNLLHVEELRCKGFTYKDWMEATSSLKSLKSAYSALMIDDAAARNVRLRIYDPMKKLGKNAQMSPRFYFHAVRYTHY
ncbi:hypothetical protein BGX28_007491 [Mortierella sp. GBA30]|nr:hypothetical protein BGX28_007491 [Mortierella sp. GBA30]